LEGIPEKNELQMVSVAMNCSKIVLTGLGAIDKTEVPPSQDWQNKLRQLQSSIDWKLLVQLSRSENQIFKAMIEGQALAISDGSFKQGHGACAWIIEGWMDHN